MFCLFLVLIVASTVNAQECTGYVNSVPLTGEPQIHEEMTFCQQFKHRTCCDERHTNSIRNNVFHYYQPEMAPECRMLAAEMFCSPCDPIQSTSTTRGVCLSSCEQWYHACKDELFALSDNSGKYIEPCNDDSMVCANLSDIAQGNAKIFCEMSGLSVATSQPSAALAPFASYFDKIAADAAAPGEDASKSDSILNMIEDRMCFKPYAKTYTPAKRSTSDLSVDMLLPYAYAIIAGIVIGVPLFFGGRAMLRKRKKPVKNVSALRAAALEAKLKGEPAAL